VRKSRWRSWPTCPSGLSPHSSNPLGQSSNNIVDAQCQCVFDATQNRVHLDKLQDGWSRCHSLTIFSPQSEMSRSVATNAESVAYCYEATVIYSQVPTVPRSFLLEHTRQSTPRMSTCRPFPNQLPADSCGKSFLSCSYWSASTEISLSVATTHLVNTRESFKS